MAAIISCVEEEDCVGCDLNPKIKVEFKALKTRTITDSIRAAIFNRIDEFKDSLETQLSDQQRILLETQLAQLQQDSLVYDELYGLFRSGKTRISYVEAPGSKGLEQFQDSIIRDFALPVDMQHDTSTFYFGYHDFVDTLQVYYQRNILQTLDGVRMRLYGIGIDREISTFDSLRVKCHNSECSNDRTTIFIYF